MNLPKISLLIILLTILQSINADFPQLKSYRKWFGVAIMNHNDYEPTQSCIQLYLIPKRTDVWIIFTIECDKLSNNTIVNPMSMTTFELNENHENGVRQLGPLINYDSERHIFFYDSDRDIFIILSNTLNDEITVIDDNNLGDWKLKLLLIEIPLDNIHDYTKTLNNLVCGNNLNGALDQLSAMLTESMIEMILGQWYTVAIVQTNSEDVELNCEQRYFMRTPNNTITMLTMRNIVSSSETTNTTIEFPPSILYDICESGIRLFSPILNFDDTKYIFLAENAEYYIVLSRTPNASISMKDDIDMLYAYTWSLRLLNHENCVYNME